MKEKIDEEVSVVMFYSARLRKAAPHIIRWRNQEFTVEKIGYNHSVQDGRTLHHIFELVVKEQPLFMRLNLDTSNLHWRLEAIHDGNAS